MPLQPSLEPWGSMPFHQSRPMVRVLFKCKETMMLSPSRDTLSYFGRRVDVTVLCFGRRVDASLSVGYCVRPITHFFFGHISQACQRVIARVERKVSKLGGISTRQLEIKWACSTLPLPAWCRYPHTMERPSTMISPSR